jgi:hypothetical protein
MLFMNASFFVLLQLRSRDRWSQNLQSANEKPMPIMRKSIGKGF